MKFSATLFTAIATTSVQALWFVPSSHSENKHQLREYLTTPAGCMEHCDGWYRSPHGADQTDTNMIQTICKLCCDEIFTY